MIPLNSGHDMPKKIYGTWGLQGEQVAPALQLAIQTGYRHFDTASAYRNQTQIGNFLQSCQIPRSQLFITTKAWPEQMRQIRQACLGSLSRLKLQYLDGYLLHWPLATQPTAAPEDQPNVTPRGPQYIDRYPLHLAWKQMEEIQKQGLVRSIGVSNWNEVLLNDMLGYAEIPPSILQIQSNLLYKRNSLIEFCHREKIAVMCYRVIVKDSPQSMSYSLPAHSTEQVDEISQKYGKTTAQVLINWNDRRGCASIVKSATAERIRENFDSLDFELEEEDFEKLNSIPDQGASI